MKSLSTVCTFGDPERAKHPINRPGYNTPRTGRRPAHRPASREGQTRPGPENGLRRRNGAQTRRLPPTNSSREPPPYLPLQTQRFDRTIIYRYNRNPTEFTQPRNSKTPQPTRLGTLPRPIYPPTMKKPSKLPLYLGVASTALAGCQSAEQKPNIVFFLADDIGTEALRCYGVAE